MRAGRVDISMLVDVHGDKFRKVCDLDSRGSWGWLMERSGVTPLIETKSGFHRSATPLTSCVPVDVFSISANQPLLGDNTCDMCIDHNVLLNVQDVTQLGGT